MDITPSTMRSLYTAISTAFNAQLGSTTTHYQTVAMTVSSTTAQNEYPRMDDLPGIREWVGDRVVHDLSMQTYMIRNKEFEGTIGVRISQVEDDQMGFLAPMSAQLGQNAAQFPDQLVFPLLKNGETTKCYDGQNFFDTDHPGYDAEGKEASVSNFAAGSSPAWYLVDDSQVIKPIIYQNRKNFQLIRKDQATDDTVFFGGKAVYGVDGRCNAGYGLWQLIYKSKLPLTAENYAAARAAMTSIRKRNGEIISINPRKLLVPSALEGAARKLLINELGANGESNEWKGTAEPVVIPLLG
ncbi:Mu-like prophage major head subunit gpT family protein [Brucella rhizosphaerae]|uniref:Mu-like prophage major head subunit gpT family protein n=1 Tax=Brucella rhizosphaerae TaxID=571254 RepID=UPI000467722C|nr:Mu-like prophage major head subunit gpT family protein [Brucella rhizosphaerae]